MIDQTTLKQVFATDAPWLSFDAAVDDGRARTLLRFIDLYERLGLLDASGEERPLWRCCLNADACWKNAVRPAAQDGGGAISLPWVGPAYESGGIAVVGMNFNDAAGLTMAYKLADWELQQLATGKRRMRYGSPGYSGSMFAYRSTRSASLLVNALEGTDIGSLEGPAGLVTTLRKIVRLQSVKCAPSDQFARGPYDGDVVSLPPMLLLRELEIAAPGAVVAFGREVRWAFSQLPGFEVRNQLGKSIHGTLPIADHRTDVFLLTHPAAPGRQWQESHEDLRAGLAVGGAFRR